MTRQIKILYICVFVLMIGYGITLPILPFYIERLALSKGTASANISIHIGVLTGSFALMQFFFAPLWGKLSDRMGRRPFFLISLGGFAISMILFGIGTNLITLYAARILGGILSSALFPIANAYVADSMPESERGKGIAWLGTSIGLGVVAGPMIGALLSRVDWSFKLNYWFFAIDKFSIPFFAAAALALIALVIANFLLDETIHTSNVKEQKRDSLPNKSYAQKVTELVSGPLRGLLVLSFLSQFALSLFEGTFAIHGQRVLNFGPLEMGMVFMVCGFIMAAVQAGVVPHLMSHKSSKFLLLLGFSLVGGALLLMMTAKSLNIILGFVTILAFGMAILIPSLSVLVIKSSDKQYGMALGIQSSANSLGQAFGPPLGALLLNWYIHLPYLLTGILMLGFTVLAWKEQRVGT